MLLFKVKKNGVFHFGVSSFVLEIFTFLYYANEESDDVIGGFTKTVGARTIRPKRFKIEWNRKFPENRFEISVHLSKLSFFLEIFYDPSAFCRVKCVQAGMERDRCGEVDNTVQFDISKFRKLKPKFLVE